MEKRKITLLLIVGLCLLTALATGVYAYPVQEGDWVKFVWTGTQGHADGGGEFAVYNSSNAKLFESFCLERDEYINLGTYYLVGHITEAAVQGGRNPSPSPDPIDPKTGYLYYKYVTGQLADYIDDNAHANALQEVIWHIEGEYYPSSHILSSLAQGFYNDAVANAGDSLWGVKVLNMYTGYNAQGVPTGFVQDQLIYQHAPEPATIILLGDSIGVFQFTI
jgi:hypothetical protein